MTDKTAHAASRARRARARWAKNLSLGVGLLVLWVAALAAPAKAGELGLVSPAKLKPARIRCDAQSFTIPGSQIPVAPAPYYYTCYMCSVERMEGNWSIGPMNKDIGNPENSFITIARHHGLEAASMFGWIKVTTNWQQPADSPYKIERRFYFTFTPIPGWKARSQDQDSAITRLKKILIGQPKNDVTKGTVIKSRLVALGVRG